MYDLNDVQQAIMVELYETFTMAELSAMIEESDNGEEMPGAVSKGISTKEYRQILIEAVYQKLVDRKQ
jgi:hypothetical protein